MQCSVSSKLFRMVPDADTPPVADSIYSWMESTLIALPGEVAHMRVR